VEAAGLAAALPVPALTAGQAIGAALAVRAVRDGGRLATITADLPDAERDITMRAVQVVPDGRRLGALAQFLAQGVLTIPVGDSFPLERAGAALAQARHGAHGSAVVLRTGGPG
jgi:NADPH:quinone reductase-like Zn-dependent oxidoreductase